MISENKNETRTVSFCVEQYSRQSKEIVLDFLYEREYLDYLQMVDCNYETLSPYEIKPSMIMVNDFRSNKVKGEGVIITVPLESFVELSLQSEIIRNSADSDTPGAVLVIVRDGRQLAELIDSDQSEVRLITDADYHRLDHSKQFLHIDSKEKANELGVIIDCYSGSPNNSKLIVFNVGQGNANAVRLNDDCTLLYDCGVSIYYSEKATEVVLDRLIKATETPNKILVISHWDLDHYKMLMVASDVFLKSIDFVIAPSVIVGRTAGKLYDKLYDLSVLLYTIPPRSRKSTHNCSPIVELPYCKLWIGKDCNDPKKRKNRASIIMELDCDNGTAVLTGDNPNWKTMVDYYPLRHNKSLNIVVPHHGGKGCDVPPVKPAVYPGVAAFSYGYNIYGHPASTTKNAYSMGGYCIKETSITIGDIYIDL